MNRLKVHRIVGLIRMRHEFPFDVDDVVEDLDGVLNFFEIFEALANQEKMLLTEELVKLALVEEYREVARMASKNHPEHPLDFVDVAR